jgi:hypothetical protein
MTVRFDTASYVRSHGKQPKGWGGWAFEFQGEADYRFYPASTYTGAKKAATADAKAAGVTVVHVGP